MRTSRPPRAGMELVVMQSSYAEEEQRTPVNHVEPDHSASSVFRGFRKEGKGNTEKNSAKLVDYDDEPGSFHVGQCHFSPGGLQYFSANCKQCQDHVAFLHHTKLTTGKKNSRPNLMSFARANSKNLAAKHSALDVQNCSSTMCTICCSCNGDLGGRGRCRVHSNGSVAFIKTGRATLLCQEVGETSIGSSSHDSEGENRPIVHKSLTRNKRNSSSRHKIRFWPKN